MKVLEFILSHPELTLIVFTGALISLNQRQEGGDNARLELVRGEMIREQPAHSS